MTSRYDIAAIKKQLAAAEKHDKEIYGEKVRKLLLEKTNLDSLKDVLHDYDIIVLPKKKNDVPEKTEKPHLKSKNIPSVDEWNNRKDISETDFGTEEKLF